VLQGEDAGLVAESPTVAHYRRDLAVSHDLIGNLLAATGDAAGAMAEHRQFRERMRALAAEAPAIAQYRSELAVAHGVDELAMAGLTPVPCRMVGVPRVAESPAALEGKLIRVVPITDLEGGETNNFRVFGQVVGVHLEPACLKDGLFDITLAQTIAQCGYLAEYAQVEHLFQMTRPRVG
jgi:flavin reductase (DIM6/NTAB) family NADH-FMN oxidoreductase RutF